MLMRTRAQFVQMVMISTRQMEYLASAITLNFGTTTHCLIRQTVLIFVRHALTRIQQLCTVNLAYLVVRPVLTEGSAQVARPVMCLTQLRSSASVLLDRSSLYQAFAIFPTPTRAIQNP